MKKFILSQIKKTKNFVCQGGVLVPHLSWPCEQAITKSLEEIMPGFGFDYLLVFCEKQGDFSHWVFDKERTLKIAKDLIGKPIFFRNKFREWLKYEKQYYQYVATLEKQGIRNLSEEYQEFLDLYIKEYSLALLTEYLTIHSHSFLLTKTDLQIWPIHRTFTQNEQLSQLQIGLELEGKFPDKKFTLRQIQFKYPLVFKKLQQHQERFYWLESSYKYTPNLTVSIFLRKIKKLIAPLSQKDLKEQIGKLQNYESLASQKTKEIKKELTVEQKRIYDLLCLNAFWHDRRKQANLVGSFWLNQFLKQVSQKYKIDFLKLQFTLPREFLEFLKNGQLDTRTIKKRLSGCLHYINKLGREEFLIGEDFSILKKLIFSQRGEEETKVIKGNCVYPGKVKGKCRVIYNPYQDKLQMGEILVCSMTRPDFIPLIKKAVAIITDEGGITCHAAIISRELSIPCLTGTKIATKVLRDGDLVEVDATKGVVKILKSNKN